MVALVSNPLDAITTAANTMTDEQAERLIEAVESNELLLRAIFNELQTLIRIHQLGITRSGRDG